MDGARRAAVKRNPMTGARTLRAPGIGAMGAAGPMMPAMEDLGPDVAGTGEGAARRLDDAELVRLEARHGQAMFGFVRRLGLSDEHAQDCVQEAFARLWSEMDRGTRVADPKAWAYRTVYRLAMDEHRLRRRVSGLVDRLGGRMTHNVAAADHADRIAVWTEVDRLPPRQRQVIYLRYRADLPFEDIGVVLGMTASAARSHATQATHTLRARLHPDLQRGDQ
jgi:RNA polymerase sigma factor (sigma-70 family)